MQIMVFGDWLSLLIQTILLVCGDKSGISQKRFYKEMIKKADSRFDNHLSKLNRRGV
jgi:hypothetical protein